jgi:hypothetical protein
LAKSNVPLLKERIMLTTAPYQSYQDVSGPFGSEMAAAEIDDDLHLSSAHSHWDDEPVSHSYALASEMTHSDETSRLNGFNYTPVDQRGELSW